MSGRADESPWNDLELPWPGLLAVRRRRITARHVLVGAGLPVLVTAVLLALGNPERFHPGTVLVLACIVAGGLAGTEAAVIAAISATLALWWAFTPAEEPWGVSTLSSAWRVVLFLVGAVGVVLLVRQTERARSREHLARQLSDTLLDQSPAAVAVFDTGLRFQRVNRPMAELNQREASEHIGRRPSEVSPLAGPLYEPLLARVRDSGQAISDDELVASIPEEGFEQHWRISVQPLRNHESVLVGIGVSITDVTPEIVSRRLAEQLLRLAESLSTALDDEHVGRSVGSFVEESLRGRSAVALLRGDALVIAAVSGFSEHDASAWSAGGFGSGESNPLADAIRSNRPVVLRHRRDFDELYPDLSSQAPGVWGETALAMPLRGDALGAVVVGVMYIGWAAARPVTETMMTLAGTVASMVSLALARIAATSLAHQNEFRHALDAMLDRVVIARAVRSDTGDIDDFRIEFVNSRTVDGAGRDPDSMVGRLVSEISPHWWKGGIFEQLCAVVETGVPYQQDRRRDLEVTDDHEMGYWSLQVAKLGDGYIAASRDVAHVVAAEQAALALVLHEESELTAIQLLQAAALPNALPDVAGVRIAAVYEPADLRQPVGGDWYDVFVLDNDRLALVIADVAGHGRSAATFMVQVRNIFRAIAVEHADPGEVLIRADNVTSRLNEPDGPFVTCCYAVFDTRARSLLWAQAGHFSPLVVHTDGSSTYLDERPGPPLALRQAQDYRSSSTVLRPGDRVLMFTDGLVERRREHLDVGLARLANAAATHSGLPPAAFVEALAATVTNRFDDLALLCVELAAQE